MVLSDMEHLCDIILETRTTNQRYLPAHQVKLDTKIPMFAPKGCCQWCGKALPKGYRRFCPPEQVGHYPNLRYRICAGAYSMFWYSISAFKRAVFIRDNFTCQACGAKPMISRGSFEIPNVHQLHCDHIKPVARGGLTETDNLQTLCENCNLRKGTKEQYVGTMSMDLI